MNNPYSKVLEQCKVGFPLRQKYLIVGCAIFYGIFPIDILPDVLPPITYLDDLFMLYLAFRVWKSPTLPKLNGGGKAVLERSLASASERFARWRESVGVR